MCESVLFVRYRRAEKQLELFADTTEPRYLTASEILDYNTVAGPPQPLQNQWEIWLFIWDFVHC